MQRKIEKLRTRIRTGKSCAKVGDCNNKMRAGWTVHLETGCKREEKEETQADREEKVVIERDRKTERQKGREE
ncbi:unnamed protein product [Dimorphilus gyrociliatus]|uniref:Uncharacterized protein n=1 Tax=Dimorphilus gyrociliatus TaxID=2664684 RepID=A0A7I8VFN0_9ANNE|nr:unnamed protein product [Dimorphilus gyrociliatus]